MMSNKSNRQRGVKASKRHQRMYADTLVTTSAITFNLRERVGLLLFGRLTVQVLTYCQHRPGKTMHGGTQLAFTRPRFWAWLLRRKLKQLTVKSETMASPSAGQ